MFKPRVLIIDDDPVFGQLLSGKGERRAMHVEYFPSLIEAVYNADLRDFDVVVLDYFMPEMDGLEIAEYFRVFHERLPIILVSHDRDKWVADRWHRTGVRAFIAKRKGLDAILDTVQKVA